MKSIELNNRIAIPVPGLGTYRLGRNDAEVEHAVRSALDAGYRHIDTATLYGNEKPIGKALRESGIPREELFVTTKLWGSDILQGRITKAFDESRQKLDIGYVDLYLVHWPVKGKIVEAWHEMEKIYESGAVRAIGVSNHLIHHLEELLDVADVVPAVNQVELHPYLVMQELQDYCHERNIVVESWSPLGSSKVPLLTDPVLLDIASKKGKSTAQVILRWNLQKGLLPLPKSSNEIRQRENITLTDFSLTEDEMTMVDMLDRNERTGVHPDEIGF